MGKPSDISTMSRESDHSGRIRASKVTSPIWISTQPTMM